MNRTKNQLNIQEKLRNSENKGFSLIELVVVIAVLTILGGISLPFLTSFINEAILSSTKNSLGLVILSA